MTMSSRGPRSEDGGGIDRAIDEAVRELLDVEPPAGFRSRVLRRIEARSLPPEGGSYKRFLWAALPMAAAAILILAVLLPRHGGQPQQTPPPATTTVRVEPPPAATAPTSPSVTAPAAMHRRRPAVDHPTATATRALQRPTHPVERMVTAAVFEPADNATTEITPLETITPIHVSQVSEHAIAPAAIAVRALNPMNELAIAPLTPPERRN
jgi:hypothetical protein